MADEISTVLKEMSAYGGEYSGELANMNDFAFDTQVAQASYDTSTNTLKAFDTQVAQVSYDASANTIKGYSNKGDYGNLFDYQVTALENAIKIFRLTVLTAGLFSALNIMKL